MVSRWDGPCRCTAYRLARCCDAISHLRQALDFRSPQSRHQRRHSTRMKAVLCRQFGPPESLVIEELPSPKPGAGEVVISVKAASVNFPDVLIIQNKYQFKPPLPFSPGSELAGVVKEVGAGVSSVRP